MTFDALLIRGVNTAIVGTFDNFQLAFLVNMPLYFNVGAFEHTVFASIVSVWAVVLCMLVQIFFHDVFFTL